MTLDARDIPFLPRGVRLHHCDVRKGWFLLAPERAVKMDPIGAAILNAVDGERPVTAVVEKLAADFGAPAEQVGKDVAAFLIDLKNKRMLEVRP
ncbi:MAG: pyrroloquinoline quinone biosynthesis peptide chaperone PqqD [Pseudomonadota bacterium]